MPDSEEAPSYREIERLGAGLLRFPEVTREELSVLSLTDLHEIVLDILEGYKANHPGSDETLEKIKYHVFGYLLREPAFLKRGRKGLIEEGKRTRINEEIAEAVKTLKILELAAYRCARENVNPFYRAAVYNNLMLMQNFSEAHGDDDQSRSIRGIYNGFKGQLALRKVLDWSQKFKQLGPDPETNPAGIFAADVLGDMDNISQYLINRDVMVTFGVTASDSLEEDYKEDHHVSGPNRTLVRDDVLDLLDLDTRSRLLNAKNRRTLFKADVAFSSNILPDLDPSLSQLEAFQKLALPPEPVSYDIIRKVERRLPKFPR